MKFALLCNNANRKKVGLRGASPKKGGFKTNGSEAPSMVDKKKVETRQQTAAFIDFAWEIAKGFLPDIANPRMQKLKQILNYSATIAGIIFASNPLVGSIAFVVVQFVGTMLDWMTRGAWRDYEVPYFNEYVLEQHAGAMLNIANQKACNNIEDQSIEVLINSQLKVLRTVYINYYNIRHYSKGWNEMSRETLNAILQNIQKLYDNLVSQIKSHPVYEVKVEETNLLSVEANGIVTKYHKKVVKVKEDETVTMQLQHHNIENFYTRNNNRASVIQIKLFRKPGCEHYMASFEDLHKAMDTPTMDAEIMTFNDPITHQDRQKLGKTWNITFYKGADDATIRKIATEDVAKTANIDKDTEGYTFVDEFLSPQEADGILDFIDKNTADNAILEDKINYDNEKWRKLKELLNLCRKRYLEIIERREVEKLVKHPTEGEFGYKRLESFTSTLLNKAEHFPSIDRAIEIAIKYLAANEVIKQTPDNKIEIQDKSCEDHVNAKYPNKDQNKLKRAEGIALCEKSRGVYTYRPPEEISIAGCRLWSMSNILYPTDELKQRARADCEALREGKPPTLAPTPAPSVPTTPPTNTPTTVPTVPPSNVDTQSVDEQYHSTQKSGMGFWSWLLFGGACYGGYKMFFGGKNKKDKKEKE